MQVEITNEIESVFETHESASNFAENFASALYLAGIADTRVVATSAGTYALLALDDEGDQLGYVTLPSSDER